MEFPLVSIIVPMYNTAGCIARCVKSICAQTYKSIEILLLNDGSADVEHIRPWEKALQHVLQRNPPRTRAYGYLPAGVYTGQEYAKHLIQKPNTFYYGSPCNKLYRRDLLRKHSLHFRKELFAEDQLFNTEYLRFVRTAVSIPDIGYYYLQNSQSVSHSRVTTADILSLRRRVMGLYKSIYTELGIYPETRAAILRSPFGENEFTLPPLDTPQTHCCKL